MADLITPRRMERIVDENGFPALRFIEYLEKNTINDSAKETTIEDLQAQIDALPDIILTESFTSSEQIITSAGALSLAHNLSSTPYLIIIHTICKTAEYNYSIGDEIPHAINDVSNAAVNNLGITVWSDGTNINLRFGSAVTVFNTLNKTTGASVHLTNAKWNLIIRAWA
ncbi:hypothetical protein KAR91_03215 [Candidatus Pacearchaeota archaeon]|nr:hypothetical protein [Candidatus Pacearchaeota archaeon]